MKIKALIFDVGGILRLGKKTPTYYKGKSRNLGVHEYISRKLKISLDQYFDSIDTVYAKSIEGKISEKKALKIMARNLKTTSKKLKEFYKQAYKENFKLNKELLKFAFKKKKQGYKIAILSDQWHLSKKILVSKDFYNKFDATIVSCDVGVRKPNPGIYKLVLKKLKLSAKETIFIDNQEWNTKPAEELGMKTVLFKNNKQAIKEIEKLLR